MRILVSNDDGIHAPGLKILEKVAHSLSKDVWVVAPEYEQSGASHSLTLTLPLRLRKINARKYAVRGTPTDCVMMAMHEIFKDKRPDLLLSGVNRGANLGEDVTYSGTVAVAMEGALLGVPSIALSQCFQHGHPVKWSTAEHHAPKVIRKLLKVGWAKDTLINVNFPDVLAESVTGIEVVPQGKRDLADLLLDARVDARGVPYYWIGYRKQKNKAKRHTDLGATENGAISVTPLQLDLTHKTGMKSLKAALA
ncbi:5'/3'-nucleotidase SurE [Ferrovibrio sp.]|uniref:5'/3'-nucleotidase SurE n=1 Tax=Ferrovibrio sp. TaxID=1917215 RepID=UPI000CB25552|nr:5'/3'-nucleotidase SurE [Ferrovibrio sp.]PJI37806.1 MAG: 5'/3'-nucleotidase SurE [Ferrovibrio sp.]